MDCREFEKLIPAFIDEELDYKTLKSFRGHMKQCDNCKEELVIQFLVTEGMAQLEDGNAFDLQGELDMRMEDADRRIRFHSSFVYLGVVLEILAMASIAGVVFWIIF